MVKNSSANSKLKSELAELFLKSLGRCQIDEIGIVERAVSMALPLVLSGNGDKK